MFERCWSRASKSTSSVSVMSAHSGLVQPLMRQCGSAMPCSRAVLPSFSRALRASRMTSWLSSESDSANTPAHSSSAFFLLLACWLRRILCGDKTSRISVLLFFKAIVQQGGYRFIGNAAQIDDEYYSSSGICFTLFRLFFP
jgi:hypothetical protein